MSRENRIMNSHPPVIVNSGQRYPSHVEVVMDVGANWSSRSMLAPISPKKYWRNRISIVLIPFILSGAPVLHNFTQNDNYYEIDSTLKWLKSIFTTYILLPLNIILILITLTINSWALYLLVDMVISLFILGEVPKNFMDDMFELAETLPIILPVDLFWIKGYLIKDMINQFDYISLESAKMSRPNLIIKLLIIYILTLLVHIIGFLTYQWKLKYGYISENIVQYYEHLPHRVLSSLLLPIYITFCSAVYYKYKCMNYYIKQLLNNSEKPQLLHFRTIKYLYKRNSNLICRINTAFSLVMSSLFGVTLLGIIRDCISTSYAILAYMALSKALSNGSAMFDLKFVREMVKCISADVLIIITKMGLIGFTFVQMVKVNDESRDTIVSINDYVTQFNHEITTSLFHSLRLLKYYAISRMERLDNPSLLTITIFSRIPILRSRLLGRI